MRNAVIRKKLLKEQAFIRKYISQPVRLIMPNIPEPTDWRDFHQQRFYNIY